ncbi:hypothetical protein [Winogradskyella flava]|uniref:Por secretion system C-terminal sorting domain-containing protein n=1 Tax=Winogradskyella flava TaxID=1884876 RepID=A0A842ISA2_9FLAO|nr:hypothetical protein [Winogradskyella flava]MBC2843758.1 hypothetical protein [Winogradskyella flava]
MKTLIKSILVVAGMLGTYTSYANETSDILPTFKYINAGDSISVTDASGEVIYSGHINYSGNLIKLFDFSKLKDGIYTVEVGKDFEIEIVNINVKNQVVTLLKDSQEKIFKPVFRAEDSKLIISKLALDSKEMKVELYFGDDLIHTETVESSDKILNRVYRLDKSNRGEYTAIIRSNGRVYVENFRI